MTRLNPFDEPTEQTLGHVLHGALDQDEDAEPAPHLDMSKPTRAGRRRRLYRWALVFPAAILCVAAPIGAIKLVQLGWTSEGVTIATPTGGSGGGGASLLDAADKAYSVTLRQSGPIGRSVTATLTGRDTWYFLAVRSDPLNSCDAYSASVSADGGPTVAATCSPHELSNGSKALMWVAETRSTSRVAQRVDVRTQDGLWITVDRTYPAHEANTVSSIAEGSLRLAALACPSNQGTSASENISWCLDQ